MLLLSNDDVQQVLDMPTCLAALEAGYEDLMKGEAAYGGRTGFSVPEAGGVIHRCAARTGGPRRASFSPFGADPSPTQPQVRLRPLASSRKRPPSS